MKAIELEKAYNPKDFEDRIYELWMANKCFKPMSDNPNATAEPSVKPKYFFTELLPIQR